MGRTLGQLLAAALLITQTPALEGGEIPADQEQPMGFSEPLREPEGLGLAEDFKRICPESLAELIISPPREIKTLQSRPQELTDVFEITDPIHVALAAHLTCEGETDISNMGRTPTAPEPRVPAGGESHE